MLLSFGLLWLFMSRRPFDMRFDHGHPFSARRPCADWGVRPLMASLTGRLIERIFFALTTSRSAVSPNIRARSRGWPRKDFPNGDRRLEEIEPHRLRLAGRLTERPG